MWHDDDGTVGVWFVNGATIISTQTFDVGASATAVAARDGGADPGRARPRHGRLPHRGAGRGPGDRATPILTVFWSFGTFNQGTSARPGEVVTPFSDKDMRYREADGRRSAT